MRTLIILIAAIAFIAAIAKAKKGNGENKGSEKAKYADKLQLLNKSEIILFNRLKEAAPGMHVFSQVSMSQIFHIERSRKDGYRQIGEIGRKSVDFLLCREDTSIVLAVEMNGPTHSRARQQTSDGKKFNALQEAGIPLIVIKPDNIPEVDELKKMLATQVIERKKYEEARNNRLNKS